MSESKQQDDDWIGVKAQDTGGIANEEYRFVKGITVLSGRNATNRTSVLEAISTAFGGSGATARETAGEGEIVLSGYGGEEYTTRIKNTPTGSAILGEQPVEDEDRRAAIDLFATVTGDNEVRQAIRGGVDGEALKEMLMRPLDSDRINQHIQELSKRRDSAQSRLNEVENAKSRLDKKKSKRNEVRSKIEDVAERLENARDKAASETDVEAIRSEQEELDAALSELEDKQSRLEDLRGEKDMAEKTINETEVDLQSAEANLTRLKATGPELNDDVEKRISELQDRRDRLDTIVSELEGIIKFNAGTLDTGLPTPIEPGESGGGEAGEQLLGETVTCWTCGGEVGKEEIETTLDKLRDIADEHRTQLSSVETELAKLREKKQEVRKHGRDLAAAEEKVDKLESKLEKRRDRLERVESEIVELREAIEEQEAKIDELDISSDEQAAIDSQQRVAELEREKGRLEGRLSSIKSDIEDTEETIADEDDIREQIAELSEEMEELRGTVSQREQDIVEQFNEASDDIYQSLGFENIERVWLERIHSEESSQAQPDTEFRLHIIRDVDGETTESSVETLSESERELVGITLALAGYIAHSVYEYMPVLLLDSLEAIDANRVDALLQYVSNHAEYVIATTLPEDEPVLSDDYDRMHFGEHPA